MQVCINVPSIVYQNSWLGLTSGLSDTFFVAPQPGLYRVTAVAYVVSNPHVGAAPASVSGGVNDGTGNQLVVLNASADASGVQTSTTQCNIPSLAVVGVTGASASSLTVGLTVSDPSHILNHYDVYVTVEQVI